MIVARTHHRGKATSNDLDPSEQLYSMLNRKRIADLVAVEEESLEAMTQCHARTKNRR